LLRELSQRGGDGLTVTLAWDDAEDVVILNVVGEGLGLTGQVPKELALDAFEHPFVYLGSTRVDPEAVPS
jgi:hypothetical protein